MSLNSFVIFVTIYLVSHTAVTVSVYSTERVAIYVTRFTMFVTNKI